MKKQKSALVVGLGIAGMASAKALAETGWDVTVVERSADRRTGGYVVALFDAGAAAAERLGILDALPSRASESSKTWEIKRTGQRRPGLGFADVPTNPRVLIRSDIERALFDSLPASVTIEYSTMPTAISQSADAASVTLRQRTTGVESTRNYDLVVGADGLHSSVRRMVFGPDANFVHDSGFMIAATLLDTPVSGYPLGHGAVLSEPGRSMWLFGLDNRAPSLLFSYKCADPAAEKLKKPIDALRAAYGPGPTGDVLGELLDRYEQADEALFDGAQQVRMRQWYNGRVALVGDAAWCMTLYSGLGASSGLAGGVLLASMLDKDSSDLEGGLREWNRRLFGFVNQQHTGLHMSRTFFTAANRREQLIRTSMIKLMSKPVVGPLLTQQMKGNFSAKNLDISA